MEIGKEAYRVQTDFKIKEETGVTSHMNRLFAMIKGTDILDAGRFHEQDFYAAKEGKHITILDDNTNRINAAKREFDTLKSEVQKNLVFFEADFFQYDFKETKFDAVVMADVLQYILFPAQWIKKAFTLLKEEGIFLSAVPFGVHPKTDAKKTYFLLDFLELVEPYGPVEDYGIWDAETAFLMAVKKKDYKGMLLDMRDILGKSEKAFLKREKMYIQKLREKQKTPLQ